jgi:uncharacterized protein YegL
MKENTVSLGRRLPVYLLIDCSGSMVGEPIQAMQMGLRALLADLKGEPQALETVWLSVITFRSLAEQVVPLTDINEFDAPRLEASGTTALGQALELVHDCITTEVRKTSAQEKGDWKPLVFVFTDGEPTDEWHEPGRILRESDMATIIACGAGSDVDEETLRRLSDNVIRLENTQPGTLAAFMRWVTASVTTVSKTVGTKALIQDLLPLHKTDGVVVVP